MTTNYGQSPCPWALLEEGMGYSHTGLPVVLCSWEKNQNAGHIQPPARGWNYAVGPL